MMPPLLLGKARKTTMAKQSLTKQSRSPISVAFPDVDVHGHQQIMAFVAASAAFITRWNDLFCFSSSFILECDHSRGDPVER